MKREVPSNSIESGFQSFEGQPQVLFDHIAGNAKPQGNFSLMEALEPAQKKNLPAARRQLLHGAEQKFQALQRFDLSVRLCRPPRYAIRIMLIIDIFLLGRLAAEMISREIDSGCAQKGVNVGDGFMLSVAKRPQVSLLQKVLRLLDADPPGNQPEQRPG